MLTGIEVTQHQIFMLSSKVVDKNPRKRFTINRRVAANVMHYTRCFLLSTYARNNIYCWQTSLHTPGYE